MDRRDLADGFRQRLSELIDAEEGGKAAFLRATGIDRSALGQFLADGNLRLPRAETLRHIADARGVSVDWLLCLENAPSGRQSMTTSVAFARAGSPDMLTPLDGWKREAPGQVIRYVPSTVPDLLGDATLRRGPNDDALLQVHDLGDHRLEIAVSYDLLHALAGCTGPWRHLEPAQSRALLQQMADRAEAAYPAIRLHVYDASAFYSPPFVVFGRERAALFLGENYLVVTSPEQIEAFSQKFDTLVRHAMAGPDRAGALLRDLS